MSIHFTIEDEEGLIYDLDTYRIDFGDVQMGDLNQRRKVIVHNTARQSTAVEVKCIAHPTHQVGSAQDTYEAARLAFDSEGPFVSNQITIGNMSPGEAQDLWILWPIPIEALPGWGVFALEVTGEVSI